MKCKKNKKHGEMELLLGEDRGWRCKKCGDGIWDLTEQELAIWKHGYNLAQKDNEGARNGHQKLKEIRKLLGIN